MNSKVDALSEAQNGVGRDDDIAEVRGNIEKLKAMSQGL